jgi:hypothetical protein
LRCSWALSSSWKPFSKVTGTNDLKFCHAEEGEEQRAQGKRAGVTLNEVATKEKQWPTLAGYLQLVVLARTSREQNSESLCIPRWSSTCHGDTSEGVAQALLEGNMECSKGNMTFSIVLLIGVSLTEKRVQYDDRKRATPIGRFVILWRASCEVES